MEERRIAGLLLLDARIRARMSQEQVGWRAGVAQSVISAYESSRRQPSLPTLLRLLKGAGYELDLRLKLASGQLLPMSGPLGQRVRERQREITELAGTFGVSRVQVFGSVARGDEHPGSDVDMLVRTQRPMSPQRFGELRGELEDVLQARVHLMGDSNVRPGLWDVVAADAVTL